MTVYLKVDDHVLVYDQKVEITDVGKIEIADKKLAERIKHIQIYQFPDQMKVNHRKNPTVVFSILRVVEAIQEELPQVDVVNMGETDFIVEYVQRNSLPKPIEVARLILVCIFTFFGAAFTIMAFNNDVSVGEVFDRFYTQIVGTSKPAISELEVGYSVGTALGILMFFNHIGKKKITSDPTPIQVEMRKYETDVNTTLIENASRKGHNEDVDNS